MVVVGYTATTFKIRNSWGATWGMQGYALWDRRIQNMCFFAQYAEYPNVISTGKQDQEGDEETENGGSSGVVRQIGANITNERTRDPLE